MKRFIIAIGFALAALVGCRQEQVADATAEAREQISQVGQDIRERFEVEVPVGTPIPREQIERERFNAEWRRLRSIQNAAKPQPTATPDTSAVQVTFARVPKFSETIEGMNPATADTLPVQVPITGDVSGPSVLRAQVFLDRARYSPGIIDGRWGKNSEIAVYWFQRSRGLPPTGEVDETTFRALAASANGPALVRHRLSADDVKGPFTKIPEDVYDQEKLDCLCYESISEKLAERFHTSRDFLARINPGVDLDALQAGQEVFVPNVRPPLEKDMPSNIARIVVSVRGNYLHALDAAGNILLHAPTTLGSEYDPSPSETVQIVKATFDPWFHYQPTLFHEVPDEEPEAHLPPGPNSPVGVVWVALSKKHFGIHGTSDPDSIGYASSHGCVRLANWDAREVAHQVRKDIPVEFVDTRREG